MRLASAFLWVIMLGITRLAQAVEFMESRVENDGRTLMLVARGGATLIAPKIDDQDSFGKPGVSNDHRYAGWLALFPNRGASYAQPLYLVVLSDSNQIQRLSGDFGMVYGWCFTRNNAVVYMYEFPHGLTPIGFDMRRLGDGKLLRRARIEPIDPDSDIPLHQYLRDKAPAWTRCAQESAENHNN